MNTYLRRMQREMEQARATEGAWHAQARLHTLSPSGVGGVRLLSRRPPRAKRVVAPETESELRFAHGDR